MNTREWANGNYYQDEKGNIEKLDTFEINYGVLEYPLHLKPIQLTEEILVNWCGAKEVMAKRGVLKEFVLKTVRIEMSNSGNFYYKNSKTDLQYLHRLQNLFHSLRNEELPLNHPSAK